LDQKPVIIGEMFHSKSFPAGYKCNFNWSNKKREVVTAQLQTPRIRISKCTFMRILP
jgi:hypothetical protein